MKPLDIALLAIGIVALVAFLVIGGFFVGRLSPRQVFWAAELGPFGVALLMVWLSRNVPNVPTVDRFLLGAGAVLLVPWLVIGLFFLSRLRGSEFLWGGNLGGMAAIMFVTGLARAIQRHRA